VPLDPGEARFIDALSCKLGGGGLESLADLDELQTVLAVHELHSEADALQQQLWSKAGDVGAVASPHVEHPRRDQRTDGLTRGVAG